MNFENVDLKGMGAAVEQIEQLTYKLKELGAGIPAVEKNSRIILSVVNVLKFGISDPADLIKQ
jgi:hypothetical protein